MGAYVGFATNNSRAKGFIKLVRAEAEVVYASLVAGSDLAGYQ